MKTKGFAFHDHSACKTEGVSQAVDFCAQNGLQLTPQRRRVLEILLEKHSAMGAYEVLDILREEGLGSQPPIAYRALDFLVSNGFAHKIERLNAFVACAHPGANHAPAFLICRVCDSVAEAHLEPDDSTLNTAAQKAGFTVERAVVEAIGICPNCEASA
ncbi:MAG: transcriptional repressor [Pseudomonadota bacterium]